MEGGKVDEKLMGPLFRRVHVSDLQKGKQRGPPRNKMALYEHLSFHSQMLFSTGSAWLPTLPPSNCCNLVSSSHHLRIKAEENPQVSHNSQISATNFSNGGASSSPLALEKISEQLKGEQACLRQKQSKSSWADDLSSLEVVSCSTPSLGDSHKHSSPNRPANVDETHEDPESGSSRVEDADRDGFSEISTVDSISHLDISPEDVVGKMGLKPFQKLRRILLRQQREFSEQVFELHRLIKVHCLIAKSPDLLVGDDPSIGKSSIETSPVSNLASESVQEANPHTAECAAENAIGKPPLPFLSKQSLITPVVDVQKKRNKKRRLFSQQQSNHQPNSRNAPPPTSPRPKPPWGFHPFEGLVFKPHYTAPPPPTGVIYGVLASDHQWIGILPTTPFLAYVLPYGMPVMNPSVFSSAVKLGSPLNRAWSKGWANQLSLGHINFTIPYQNSWNMLSERRQLIPCWTENSVQVWDQPDKIQGADEQRGLVIKAIPHDPGSAFESAAQIYQSIQVGNHTGQMANKK